MPSLSQSYDYCRDLTRRTAHNFRFSFMTLPREKRRAMNALYAFNRITDDIGDEEKIPLELRRTRLAAWRQSLRNALCPDATSTISDQVNDTSLAEISDHPAKPAVVDIVKQYQIPPEYLFAVIDGVESDLFPMQIRAFKDLEQYCYHVAGAVGICCIHIWGFRDQAAIPLAIQCGTALQLTNILRDIREDAANGRIYLPAEDLQSFGYSPDELHRQTNNEAFLKLMRFEADRAKSFYAQAERLFEHLEPCGKPILRTMIDIYGGLLREIERRNFDVFSKRVSLPKWKKLWFAGRAILSSRSVG